MKMERKVEDENGVAKDQRMKKVSYEQNITFFRSFYGEISHLVLAAHFKELRAIKEIRKKRTRLVSKNFCLIKNCSF